MSSSNAENKDALTVGLPQYTPVWLDRAKTLEKASVYLTDAAKGGCELVILGGEASVGGYPFWLELTGGAVFNSPIQKAFFAEYSNQAVQIERGDLRTVCDATRDNNIAAYIGIVEKPPDRGESLYCSLVFIDKGGNIRSVHRKLIPTYDERLVWGIGDGNGLRVHGLGAFTVGGLNCWENWNPLIRTSLYAQGEDFHVCVFPGGIHLVDLTRFIAKESRSFAASVCCVLRTDEIPADVPNREMIVANAPEILANGGTCLAGPDGEWIVEPLVNEEKLIVATIDHKKVREERQNFDPVGHYSRPDVLQLKVNRERQTVVEFEDE